MKPIKTTNSDVNLTLSGGTEDNDLPAQRILVYNGDIGETEKDAHVAFESLWMPDEGEARKLEAGAAVVLRVWAIRAADGKYTQPPVSLGVTDAVVPEQELVLRGQVDRALGLLYGALREKAVEAFARHAHAHDIEVDDVLPDAGAFVDLWIQYMQEAVADPDAPQSNGSPAARADDDGSDIGDPISDDDLTGPDFLAGIQLIVGKGTTIDVDSIPGDGGWMVRTTYQGKPIMAQGRTRRAILKRLRSAADDVAKENEHGAKDGD